MVNTGQDGTAVSRPAASRATTVLYVEDDPVNATLFAALVAQVPGLQLSIARSGAEALAIGRDLAPGLLLLDHGLPDTDGGALLGRLRSEAGLRHVPAFLLTGLSPDEAEACVREAGFDGCWIKPLDVRSTLAWLGRIGGLG